MGRTKAVSINNLLKETGYSEKTIEAILKYYGQRIKSSNT
jgi:predicted Ser/Thr protein kinase